ncbi:MAG: hypothetical protein Q2306_02380 [Phytoplasma sp.]|uniref:hypothetical protein n=1 Tax=Phytoplasma sp. TaxID=2155 RepID=UPI002B4120B7|nr:hypothetical protein [Phytoplasma sp.]WRH06716.1 MAG: hypothetical protein Q2306_02380 [Phytoplasma sp.]
MNIKNLSKKAVKRLQILFLIIVTSVFAITAVNALSNLFISDSSDQIDYEISIPHFEAVKTISVTEGKKLIPCDMPNFNTNKYLHKILFNYDVNVDPKNIDINIPLYLKITTELKSDSSFELTDYFGYDINVDGKLYNNSEKIFFDKPKIKTTKKVNFVVQMKQHLKTQHNVFLKAVYQLTDQDGNSFGGSEFTVNKIVQTA